jgi:tRNA (guanine37-N1)-methyltransferase
MKIQILTIFPQMFEPIISESIIKRAQEKGLVEIQVHDLRKWTTDTHKTIDDKPYGGGAGMVMMVEPIFKALQEIKTNNSKVTVLSAKGESFNQKKAQELSTEQDLIFIAPHYEGIDQRVIDELADYEISIGDYVLTGGELPTLVIVDAVTRLLPGVLGNDQSLTEESHTDPGVLEYPQYTRPEDFNGWKVPEVLLSGNHKNIEEWKRKNKTTKPLNGSN